jgi:hypothetical protein
MNVLTWLVDSLNFSTIFKELKTQRKMFFSLSRKPTIYLSNIYNHFLIYRWEDGAPVKMVRTSPTASLRPQ